MLKSLKVFADWQQNWLKVVRANFKLKKAKACFKQIYLFALKAKIKRARLLQTLNIYFSQIKLYSIETKKVTTYYRTHCYERCLKHKAFNVLKKRRNFRQFARRAKEKVCAIRNTILCQLAVKSLKMFAEKAKLFKHDLIRSRMLYSDHTIFDKNGDFVILSNCEEFEFIKV